MKPLAPVDLSPALCQTGGAKRPQAETHTRTDVNKIRKKPRATAPSYLELPVPVRAVAAGLPVVVVNAGIGGCGCESEHKFVGLRDVHELTDFEPLIWWLVAVGRKARRTQRRIELPLPVLCVRRDGNNDTVSLFKVRPDGLWLGYDEDGWSERVRLPEVMMTGTSEEYLGEICEATRFLDEMVTGRAAPCTRG